jgi:hypothetical protein
MKPKTRFLAILAIAALALGPPVFAQVSLQDLSATNNIPQNATTTTELGSAIPLSQRDNVGILVSFKLQNGGTENQTLIFARSGDGTTYETWPRITWTIPANGTTTVVAYTNVPNSLIGAAYDLKLVSWANGCATNYVTNITVNAVLKRDPGK